MVFTHEIDSLGHFETVDCGVFTKLPNGDDLETGQMPRTDLPGAPIRDYEEIWRDIDLPTSGASWILESEADPAGQQFEGDTSKDGEANGVVKTFVGVVLGHFIALRQRQWLEVEEQNGRKVARKRGGAVSARREESISTGDNSFMTIFSIGDESETLSLRADIENGLELSEKVGPGEVLTVNDCKYIVRAFEK